MLSQESQFPVTLYLKVWVLSQSLPLCRVGLGTSEGRAVPEERMAFRSRNKTPVLGDGLEYTSDSNCGGASASLSVSGCVPSMCVFCCGAVMLPERELGAVVTSVPS